jgi:hypothetical protein
VYVILLSPAVDLAASLFTGRCFVQPVNAANMNAHTRKAENEIILVFPLPVF